MFKLSSLTSPAVKAKSEIVGKNPSDKTRKDDSDKSSQLISFSYQGIVRNIRNISSDHFASNFHPRDVNCKKPTYDITSLSSQDNEKRRPVSLHEVCQPVEHSASVGGVHRPPRAAESNNWQRSWIKTAVAIQSTDCLRVGKGGFQFLIMNENCNFAKFLK